MGALTVVAVCADGIDVIGVFVLAPDASDIGRHGRGATVPAEKVRMVCGKTGVRSVRLFYQRVPFCVIGEAGHWRRSWHAYPLTLGMASWALAEETSMCTSLPSPSVA